MNKICKNALSLSAALCMGATLFAPSFAVFAAHAEEEQTPASDYVLTQQTAEYSEDLWADAPSYDMTPVEDPAVEGATGSVKYLLLGSVLYQRISAHDETKNTGDTPVFKITIGTLGNELQTGRYLEPVEKTENNAPSWKRQNGNLWDFAEVTETISNAVTYANSTYTYTSAFNLGEYVGNGAKITLMAGHGDAYGDDNWVDGLTNYKHALKFEQEFTVDGEGEIITPPPPVEYPVDPEPTEGPENTDLKIVLTDLAKMPLANESSWANVQKYDMIAKNGNSEGATGTVQVVTCDGNLIFRVEIHDDTIAWGRDSRWIQFGNEDLGIVTRGNYDTAEGVTGWLAHKQNDFGEPSLCICETTLTEGTDKTGNETSEEQPYGNSAKGVYVYYFGYQIRDNGYDITPGNTIHLFVSHGDSQHKGHGWADGEYPKFHTIYFDQVLTFGEPADTTVRPETPAEGFDGTLGTVDFNKATIGWNDVSGAELYRLRLYKVNAEGSEEPYTFVKEETVYGGEQSYEYTFKGLDAETKYAVQVLALNDDEEIVSASSLVNFTTIEQGGTVTPPVGGDEDEEEEEKKKGCGSAVGFGTLIVTASTLALSAAVIVAASRRKQK